MHITYCKDYREMSQHAASLVMDEVMKKPGLLLCAATGSSPEGLYRKLAHIAGRERQLFK
jgi:galactosamine-6-phosphate isomerase